MQEATPSNEMLYANIKGNASVPLQDKPYMLSLTKYPLVSTTIFSGLFDKVDSYGGPTPPTAVTKPVENTVYQNQVQYPPEFKLTVNGNQSDSATTLSFTNVEAVRAYDILYVPSTKERIQVVSRNVSAKTIVAVRNSGNTNTGNTLTDGETVLILPSADTDGASMSDGVQWEQSTEYAATQIVRAELEVGGSAEAERQQGGPPLAHQRILKAQGICIKFERFAFFNKAPKISRGATYDWYALGADGKPRYITDGIDVNLTTNRFDAGGTLDETELDTYLNQIGADQNFNDEPLWCYAGDNIMTAINSYAKDKIQVQNLPTKYGGRVHTYMHAKGEVYFVNEPLFSAKYGLADVAYFLRPKYIEISPKKGREFKMYPKVQSMETHGVDKTVDAYLGEYGVFVKWEHTMGVIENVTG